VRTDAWEKEYKARIEPFARIVQGSQYAADLGRRPALPLQEHVGRHSRFQRVLPNQAAEAVGGSFVDIWDGFVDQDGAFVLSGSDINGQTVRLRNSDGINFTTAGKRKLAFYVERQIKQMFGDAASSLLTVLAPEAIRPCGCRRCRSEDDLVRIDPIPISDPELDGGRAARRHCRCADRAGTIRCRRNRAQPPGGRRHSAAGETGPGKQFRPGRRPDRPLSPVFRRDLGEARFFSDASV
jgi:hypothetical protein